MVGAALATGLALQAVPAAICSEYQATTLAFVNPQPKTPFYRTNSHFLERFNKCPYPFLRSLLTSRQAELSISKREQLEAGMREQAGEASIV